MNDFFTRGESLVDKRNEAFIQSECIAYKTHFDTFEKHSLTYSQRQSIIIDECNNLVIAGAGTGKTSTIIGKVGYIIKKGLARPEEILLMAFERGVRKELQERIASLLEVKPTIRTFHALGLSIIAESTNLKPTVSKLSTNSDLLHQKLQQFIQRRVGLGEQYTLDDFSKATRARVDTREISTIHFWTRWIHPNGWLF